MYAGYTTTGGPEKWPGDGKWRMETGTAGFTVTTLCYV